MKTLAQFKRDLSIGTKVVMLSNYGNPYGKLCGICRPVVHVQSNAIAFEGIDGKPKSWLSYPKAELLEYDGDMFKIFEYEHKDGADTTNKILALEYKIVR